MIGGFSQTVSPLVFWTLMEEILVISWKQARLEMGSLRQRLPGVFIYSFSYFGGYLGLNLGLIHAR